MKSKGRWLFVEFDDCCRAYSKYVNESRLKVLAAQEGAVQETIAAARQQLMKIAKGGKYQELMHMLFIQVRPSVLDVLDVGGL